jgi:hypothetical protein
VEAPQAAVQLDEEIAEEGVVEVVPVELIREEGVRDPGAGEAGAALEEDCEVGSISPGQEHR